MDKQELTFEEWHRRTWEVLVLLFVVKMLLGI